MYNKVRRSFLSCSSHPLLSHLGPAACRHGHGGSVVRGGGGDANRGMSRGYYSGWNDYQSPYGGFSSHTNCNEPGIDASEPDEKSDESGGRPDWLAPLLHRRQLYLAVDDWSNGFSLYKLDLNDGNNDMGSQPLANHVRRLPPQVMRLEFPRKYVAGPLLAIGSKIVACTEAEDGITAIYDTRTGAQTMARCHPNVLHYNKSQAAMLADDTLYAFVSGHTGPYNSSFSSGPQQSGMGGMFCLEGMSKLGRGIKELIWKTDPFPLPFELNYGCGKVTSYAVHPEGNSIFVSVINAGTYSYHTEKFEWTHLGTWMMPFTGQAHYDDELEAWVGHSQEQGVWKLGCFDVLSPWHRGNPAPPSWNLCKEEISSVESSLDFDLISVGSGLFCLVESLQGELRISFFRGRYNKKGELKIRDHLHRCSYALSRYSRHPFQMKAFLM